MELTHWKENKEIIGSKQDQPFLPGNELFSQMELYLPFVGANSIPCALLHPGIDQPAQSTC